jgi:methylated-DNA-[protein]-cysteine S-methyltransferase
MKRNTRPANFSKKRPFAERVRAVVRKIPSGKTLTYGQVALKAGAPGAARAVGSIMAHNYDDTIPCHRVVRADGGVGDYNRGGPMRKMELLMEEAYNAKAH